MAWRAPGKRNGRKLKEKKEGGGKGSRGIREWRGEGRIFRQRTDRKAGRDRRRAILTNEEIASGSGCH